MSNGVGLILGCIIIGILIGIVIADNTSSFSVEVTPSNIFRATVAFN